MVKKELLKAGRTTKIILGAFALLMSIFYAITSLGLADWSRWIFPIVGLTLGSVILAENGVVMWFKKSTYKQIDGRDFLGVLSLLVGGAVIIQSIMLLPPLTSGIPAGVLQSFGIIGAIAGGVAGVLAVFHMLT